jgi:hypothetical protein
MPDNVISDLTGPFQYGSHKTWMTAENTRGLIWDTAHWIRAGVKSELIPDTRHETTT